jgi:hypothetical protein
MKSTHSKLKRRNGMIPKKAAAKALLTLFGCAALVLLLNTLGHCATTSSRKNSLGTVSYDANPYAYLAGSLTATSDSVTEVDGNLNLRINPLGTYLLYDESILLCGLPIAKFEGVQQPFVLTYERKGHRSVQGIACHELVSVNHLVEKKP